MKLTHINHDEFFQGKNLLVDYDDNKEAMKNPNTFNSDNEHA